MHSAVAEEIQQSSEYQCSQKEADDGPDIARLRSDRRVGGVQRVWKVRISNWHRACATGPELGRAGGKTYFAVYGYFHISGTKLTGECLRQLGHEGLAECAENFFREGTLDFGVGR